MSWLLLADLLSAGAAQGSSQGSGEPAAPPVSPSHCASKPEAADGLPDLPGRAHLKSSERFALGEQLILLAWLPTLGNACRTLRFAALLVPRHQLPCVSRLDSGPLEQLRKCVIDAPKRVKERLQDVLARP